MSNFPAPKKLSIDAFRYDLPEDRIAIKPLDRRDQSKLLVYRQGQITDSHFDQADTYLESGDLLIFNQTKVIRARLLFQKSSGSTIEIMCLEPFDEPEISRAFLQKKECQWNALVGNAKRWKEPILRKNIKYNSGSFELCAEQIKNNNGNFVIRFFWDADLTFAEVIEAAGKIPLPPYLNREADEDDVIRYQTVYAKDQGSVAAPTAGLHFTENSFAKLKAKAVSTAFITLHVGAGTFKPVKAPTMQEHEMHEERVSIPVDVIEKILHTVKEENRVISVGTTSLRTLESLYWFGVHVMKEKNVNVEEMRISQWEPYEDEADKNPSPVQALETILSWMKKNNRIILSGFTQILIAPGYEFKIANVLITNFHQPESTLLLLVSAFIGEDWKKVYQHALQNNYRFLSYGDSSLLFRK